jgi:hypothetical protein
MTSKKAKPAAVKSSERTTVKGKTLEDFRIAHDKNYIVPKKIKDALAKLGESWEYEIDFMKIAGISTTDLVNFREQFESHIVAVKSNGSHRKNVWAGTVAFAAKLREMST